MSYHLLFSPRQLGRYLLALLLLPGGRQARAQAAEPQPAWAWVRPGTLVYLDGKPSTLAEIQRLGKEAISSGEGVELAAKDPVNQLFGPIMAPAAEIITTKANANSPAVLALADRLDLRVGYTEKPAAMSAVAPKALAYITSHYPQAWLGGEVTERTQKSTGAVRYHVQLADRWGWHYVDFTPAGEVIEHSLASPFGRLLVLTLAYPPAQIAPITDLRIEPAGPTDPKRYAPVYLDGHSSSQEALRTLNPDSIAGVAVLRQEFGQLLAPEAAGLGVLVITTKQGQSQPAVAAFSARVHQLEIIQRLASHSSKSLAASTAPALPASQKGTTGAIRYYLNDKPIAAETIEKLDQNTIASVEVISGAAAATYAHAATVGGVVLLKTKQPY